MALYNSDGNRQQALTNIATIQGDGIFLLKDFVRYCETTGSAADFANSPTDSNRHGARWSFWRFAALPAELSADAVEFQLGRRQPKSCSGE